MRPLIPLAFLILLPLRAHDIEASIQFAAPAVIVRAAYSGSDPVPFASVSIYGPGSPDPFQTGRTDRQGRFSFVPNGPGQWRFVVDDEEGHRREETIPVPEHFSVSSAAPAPHGPSRLERALTGVALLAGLTGVAYGIRSRRPPGK